MKNKYLLFFLFLSAIICFSASCKKHGIDPNPLSQLPPATQTGANTLGALVNGQAFVNRTSAFSGKSSTHCTYIYLNNGFYLGISGSNNSSSDYIASIGLGADSLQISEGKTYILKNDQPGNVFSNYILVYGVNPTITYATSSSTIGQLYISKFDQNNQIISGTFFFTAVNANGDTVHVTDGRFDMKYTR